MFRPMLAALVLSISPAMPRSAVAGVDAAAATGAERFLMGTGVSGGLVVHLGCGDGFKLAEWGKLDGFQVHGLDRSEKNVAAARERLQALGLYGEKATVGLWEGERLPFIDNLVNLLVIEEGMVPAREEITRVLAPGGVVRVDNGLQWEMPAGKRRPSAMDEWTHHMYDSTGNPVSRDKVVGPPVYLQWVAGPRWGRHHDHMASFSAMVSAGNRVFYIIDEGSKASIMLPSKWSLIARDAFNGVVLWKRPIPEWWTRFHPLKSGPAQLPRKLVATKDHVYVTLGLDAPLSRLDAATGKTLQTYKGTEDTWEVVLNDGWLYAVIGPRRTEEHRESVNIYPRNAPGNPINKLWKRWDSKLHAIDADSGEVRWQRAAKILPGTLAVADDTVYFHNSQSIVAMDKTSGKQRWVSPPVEAIDLEKGIPTCYMPRLAVDNGVVVFAGGRGYEQHMKSKALKMVALDCFNGKVLWEAPHYESGYQSPEDLLVANKVVLSPFSTWMKPKDPKNNHVVGSDLRTGKVVFDYAPDVEDPVWFIHHRCYPSKATTEYLLMSKEGVEFLDLKTGHWKIHHWVRGECLYGIMPANGLVYAPMHDCACSADMKLNGLNALAGVKARRDIEVYPKKHRLTKGPAFGKVPREGAAATGDWPTYRGNPARSGVATCEVSSDLKKAWTAEIGGRLTSPVVAGGQLFAAATDRHTLYALDAEDGGKKWAFIAGGRIDSPPTVHQGMVLFGCRDGCVYCLRATDGEVVWRFRPVAEDRRLMAFEQVESVWPIHGSVLVRNDEAWFVAGRSSFLDGGLQMYRLKPETGEVISHATFDGKGPGGRVLTGAEEKKLVGLPDVLSSVGDDVYMRAGAFRPEGDAIKRAPSKVHLFSSYGFLDDSWFHRSYWVYNDSCSHRHSYSNTGKTRPAGRILVVDEKNVYGFGRQKQYFRWTTPMEYRLFAESKVPPRPAAGPKGRRRAGPSPPLWEADVPILATGLVLAGDTLFAAGPPDVLDETREDIRSGSPQTLRLIRRQDEALAGRHGGLLMAVSKASGAIEGRIELASPPVLDGLIAAREKLYMATKGGSLECWKAK